MQAQREQCQAPLGQQERPDEQQHSVGWTRSKVNVERATRATKFSLRPCNRSPPDWSPSRRDADNSNSVSAPLGASHPRSSSSSGTSFPRPRLRRPEELCDRVGQRQKHLAGDAGQADAPRRQDGTQETDARHREPCLFAYSPIRLLTWRIRTERASAYIRYALSPIRTNSQLTEAPTQQTTSLLTEVGSSLPTRHTARLATHGTESSSGSLRKRRTSCTLGRLHGRELIESREQSHALEEVARQ